MRSGNLPSHDIDFVSSCCPPDSGGRGACPEDFVCKAGGGEGGSVQRPPESGGQHDRDEVEIVREEVPQTHRDRVCSGTSARATRSGRAALLSRGCCKTQGNGAS